MKRLLLITIGLLLVITLPTLLAQSNLTNLTSNPVCYSTCFQGIEPGSTYREDLEYTITNGSIPYTTEMGADGIITHYLLDWSTKSLDLANNSSNVIVTIGEYEIVNRVTLLLRDVTVTDVINVYGAPSWLGNNGSNVLVYAHLNIVFTVSNADETLLTSLDILTPEGLLAGYTKLASCAGQSAVCNLTRATAVPTDTPTFTPSPTPPAGVQDLRDLLTYDNCPLTCFIDIIPGVSTDYEALDQLYAWGMDVVSTENGTTEVEKIYSWKTYGDFTSLSSGTPNDLFEGIIGFSNGITRYVSFTLAVPISTFITAYGAPDHYLVSSDAADYLLVYLKEGMVVSVSRIKSLDDSAVIILADNELIRTILNSREVKPVRNCIEPFDICTVQTATPTPRPTFTPSPTPTATIAPIPREPPLNITVFDSFDDTVPVYWSSNVDWFLVTDSEGKAFRTNVGTPITFIEPSLPHLNDVAVELQARFSAGILRMELHGYAAELHASGQVYLFRLGQLMTTAVVSPSRIGSWHGFRLSTVDGVARVSVDGVEVAGFVDSDPLRVASWVVSASGLGDDGLTIDDVIVWWYDRSQVYSTQPPPPTLALVSPNQILSATRDASAETTLLRYTVQEGDTLESIAVRFNTNVNALAEANGFHVDEPLRAGMELKIVIRRG